MTAEPLTIYLMLVVCGSQINSSMTAVEAVRINKFEEFREAERIKFITNGFSYVIPPADLETPKAVLDDSRYCNTPAHRRAQARDGAVMRR